MTMSQTKENQNTKDRSLSRQKFKQDVTGTCRRTETLSWKQIGNYSQVSCNMEVADL